MLPALYWFDRFDDRIGMMPLASPLRHTEELGGEDTIRFASPVEPTKYDRLLWLDHDRWREYVVCRTERPLRRLCTVYAESAVNELLDDYIEERTFKAASATTALGVALAPTRWTLGTVGVVGVHDAMAYRMNCLALLRKIEDVWGGEHVARYDVAGGRVSRRTIDLVARRGAWNGAKFVYARNMSGCTRTLLDDEVYTALYGYGAGLPSVDDDGRWTGGYKRKLTFGEVNGGINWVGDESAREVWGRWNAGRTAKMHRFGQVVFSDCESPKTLLELTRAALADASQPKMAYEVSGVLLDQTVELGDDVEVIDTSVEPAWITRQRVIRRERTISDAESVVVTLANRVPSSYRASSDTVTRVAAIEATGDVAAAGVAAIDAQMPNVATAEDVTRAVNEFADSMTDLAELGY